jgi:hypothetical protein
MIEGLMLMLGEMLKPLRNLLIIVTTLFILLLFNFNSKYYSNTFKVTINNQDIYVCFYEHYNRGLIPFILGTFNSKGDLSNEVSPIVNNINFVGAFKLMIKEYEVYYKDSNERSYRNQDWIFHDKYDYKETRLSNINLVIQRKNKTLYEGNYIEDIGKYVNEPGRYFFKVTVKRKDNFYSTVMTYMSFNVIVGGGSK